MPPTGRQHTIVLAEERRSEADEEEAAVPATGVAGGTGAGGWCRDRRDRYSVRRDSRSGRGDPRLCWQGPRGDAGDRSVHRGGVHESGEGTAPPATRAGAGGGTA